MSRPSRIADPLITTRLLEAIRGGAALEACAAYAGISFQTFLNWRERGRAAAAALEADPEADPAADPAAVVEQPERPYLEFFEAVELALAECQVTAVQALRGHFESNFRAPTEFLARRFPEQWSERRVVQHQGGTQNEVRMVQVITPANLPELARLLGAAGLLPPGEVVDGEVVDEDVVDAEAVLKDGRH